MLWEEKWDNPMEVVRTLESHSTWLHQCPLSLSLSQLTCQVHMDGTWHATGADGPPTWLPVSWCFWHSPFFLPDSPKARCWDLLHFPSAFVPLEIPHNLCDFYSCYQQILVLTCTLFLNHLIKCLSNRQSSFAPLLAAHVPHHVGLVLPADHSSVLPTATSFTSAMLRRKHHPELPPSFCSCCCCLN